MQSNMMDAKLATTYPFHDKSCADVAEKIVAMLNAMGRDELYFAKTEIRPSVPEMIHAGFISLLENELMLPIDLSITASVGVFNLSVINFGLKNGAFRVELENFYKTLDSKLNGAIQRS